MHDSLAHTTDELIATARWMSARDMLPATSGNLSFRVSETQVAITASGCDKGELTPRDVVIVELDGPREPRASAETSLHLQLYRDVPGVGCVLHGHSLAATVVSGAHAAAGEIALSGYELLKAFSSVTSHEARVAVPIFANDQDMARLAARVAARLARAPGPPCYLLAGHGAYAWGSSIREARRHLEALEFLLRCRLHDRGDRP